MCRAVVCVVLYACLGVSVAEAQDPSPWQFMHDGAAFGVFNHQGGPRGTDEFRVPNWWMGMASRPVGPSQLTFNAMLGQLRKMKPATSKCHYFKKAVLKAKQTPAVVLDIHAF